MESLQWRTKACPQAPALLALIAAGARLPPSISPRRPVAHLLRGMPSTACDIVVVAPPYTYSAPWVIWYLDFDGDALCLNVFF